MLCRKIENNRKLSNHIDHGFVNHKFQLLVCHGMSFFDPFLGFGAVWCVFDRWPLPGGCYAHIQRCTCQNRTGMPWNQDARDPSNTTGYLQGAGGTPWPEGKTAPRRMAGDWWFQSQMGTELTLPAGCAWVVKWPPKKKETLPQQNPTLKYSPNVTNLKLSKSWDSYSNCPY